MEEFQLPDLGLGPGVLPDLDAPAQPLGHPAAPAQPPPVVRVERQEDLPDAAEGAGRGARGEAAPKRRRRKNGRGGRGEPLAPPVRRLGDRDPMMNPAYLPPPPQPDVYGPLRAGPAEPARMAAESALQELDASLFDGQPYLFVAGCGLPLSMPHRLSTPAFVDRPTGFPDARIAFIRDIPYEVARMAFTAPRIVRLGQEIKDPLHATHSERASAALTNVQSIQRGYVLSDLDERVSFLPPPGDGDSKLYKKSLERDFYEGMSASETAASDLRHLLFSCLSECTALYRPLAPMHNLPPGDDVDLMFKIYTETVLRGVASSVSHVRVGLVARKSEAPAGDDDDAHMHAVEEEEGDGGEDQEDEGGEEGKEERKNRRGAAADAQPKDKKARPPPLVQIGERVTFFTNEPGANNNLHHLAGILRGVPSQDDGLEELAFREVSTRLLSLLTRMAWHFYAFMNRRFLYQDANSPESGEHEPPYAALFFPYLDDIDESTIQAFFDKADSRNTKKAADERKVRNQLFADVTHYATGARRMTFRGFLAMVLSDARVILRFKYGVGSLKHRKYNVERCARRVATKYFAGEYSPGMRLIVHLLGGGVGHLTERDTKKYLERLRGRGQEQKDPPDGVFSDAAASIDVPTGPRIHFRGDRPQEIKMRVTHISTPSDVLHVLVPMFLLDFDPFRAPMDLSRLPGLTRSEILEDSWQQQLALDCFLPARSFFAAPAPRNGCKEVQMGVMRSTRRSGRVVYTPSTGSVLPGIPNLEGILWNRLNICRLRYQYTWCQTRLPTPKEDRESEPLYYQTYIVDGAKEPVEVCLSPVIPQPDPVAAMSGAFPRIRNPCSVSFMSTPIFSAYVLSGVSLLRGQDESTHAVSRKEDAVGWIGARTDHGMWHPSTWELPPQEGMQAVHFTAFVSSLLVRPSARTVLRYAEYQDPISTAGDIQELHTAIGSYYHRMTAVEAHGSKNREMANVTRSFGVPFQRFNVGQTQARAGAWREDDRFRTVAFVQMIDEFMHSMRVAEVAVANRIRQKVPLMTATRWLAEHIRTNVRGADSRIIPPPAPALGYTDAVRKWVVERVLATERNPAVVEDAMSYFLTYPWMFQRSWGVSTSDGPRQRQYSTLYSAQHMNFSYYWLLALYGGFMSPGSLEFKGGSYAWCRMSKTQLPSGYSMVHLHDLYDETYKEAVLERHAGF